MGIRRLLSKLLRGSESSSSQDNGAWVDGSNVTHIEPFAAGKVTRNFRATVADELSVAKGTKVKAIYREDDWIYVHASDGKHGFLPENYCRLNADLSKDSHRKCAKTLPRAKRTTSQKMKRITSCREREKPSRILVYKYLHSDLHKSSLQRFIDNLPVEKDGQPFHVNDLGRATVVYGYDAVKAEDLTVFAGEEVTILNIDDPDWTYVRDKSRFEGFVPARYLDIYKHKPPTKSNLESENRLIVENFDGVYALDISVEEGEWVTALSDDAGGWMWVRRLRDGSEGFLPSKIAILATNL